MATVAEDVSDADVLRLGLDGHLKLSANFVNGARGPCGPAVSINDAKRSSREVDADILGPPPRAPWTPEPEVHVLSEVDFADWIVATSLPALGPLTGSPSTGGGEAEGKTRTFFNWLDGLLLGDGRVLEHDRETEWLDGVWDLTMLGHERLEIEQIYQFLTGGPVVDMPFQDGPLDHPIVSREARSAVRWTADDIAKFSDLRTCRVLAVFGLGAIGQQSPQRPSAATTLKMHLSAGCPDFTTLALRSLEMSHVAFFNIDQVERLLNNGRGETLRNLSRQAHGTGATRIHSKRRSLVSRKRFATERPLLSKTNNSTTKRKAEKQTAEQLPAESSEELRRISSIDDDEGENERSQV